MAGKKLSPARRAVLERRAAAARRRAFLTFSLFLATVIVSVVAFTTPLNAWFITLPAALTVAVLYLGRRAVVADMRADEAYEARRNAVRYAPRQMSETERRLSGRPVPAVRTGIPTAHAENVSTTVLSRVESSMFAKKHITGRPVSESVSSNERPGSDVSQGEIAVQSGASSSSTKSPNSAKPQRLAQPFGSAKGNANAQTLNSAPNDTQADASQERPTLQSRIASQNNSQQSTSASKTWTARAVPQPTYVGKAAAPRWEAPGITAELKQITKARMAQIAQEAELQATRTNNSNIPATTAASAPTEPQSLSGSDSANASQHNNEADGFSLNSILERRRAV